MSTLFWILLVFGLLFVTLMSFPVIIQIKSKWTIQVRWTMFKLKLAADGSQVQTDFLIFNRKFRFRRKKSSEKKVKDKGKKKAKKKLPFDSMKEVIFDKTVSKLLGLIVRFSVRLIKAFKISALKYNFGLTDYYWQGILTGLAASLPQSENFIVRGNFEETHDLFMIIHMSLWRLLWAVVLLAIFFPYFRLIKLLLKVRRNLVLVESS